MVPYKDGLTLPRINPDLCVGCGGCEHICPVRPNPAIYPEGNGTHLEAKIFVEPKIEDQINTQPGSKVLKQEDSTKKDAKEVKIDDFGF
jgi:ferredoxin